MFSFLKVIGFIDEVIIARIDQKCHKNCLKRYLGHLRGHIIAKMKQNDKVINIIYVQYTFGRVPLRIFNRIRKKLISTLDIRWKNKYFYI